MYGMGTMNQEAGEIFRFSCVGATIMMAPRLVCFHSVIMTGFLATTEGSVRVCALLNKICESVKIFV